MQSGQTMPIMNHSRTFRNIRLNARLPPRPEPVGPAFETRWPSRGINAR